MVGAMAVEETEIMRYTSIIRSVEAAGGAISCKLTGAFTWISYRLSNSAFSLVGISATHAPVTIPTL